MEELKQVASRVMAQHLDRSKPLWEIWIVEGLQGDRFALIAKTHHCMIDGASGVELAQLLLSPDPQAEPPEPRAWIPRPTPSPGELLRDETLDRLGLPLRIARGLRSFRNEVDDLGAELRLRLGVLRDLAGMVVTGASPTPINGKLSPHRRFDWFTLQLADVKAVRKALDCTVNDVVLATVTEAVRRFLAARQVRLEEIIFRASTPVSVRRESEKGQLGNRVSTWILELPIGEPDRRRQLEILRDRTRELKRTRQALGVDMLMAAAELAPSGILSFGAQLASGPINTVVTNVPGPQFPLHMLGAKMLAMIPQVPLLEGLGLCIALMSYDGQIFWGFTADYELVPDLSAFVECIAESFEELAAVAGVGLEAGARGQERARAVVTPVRPAERVIQGTSVA
jgi:WS/DGAT/MGAT family acyltransferase